MAIAGLHTVSVVENSFLRESQSRSSGSRENGSTRASSLLQMWREIEDDHVVSHAQERANERVLHQRSNDLSMANLSDSRRSEHSGVSDDASVSENEFEQWLPDRFGSQNGNEDSSNFNCEHSSDLGEIERERVRKIFQEWKNSGDGSERTSNSVSGRNNGSMAQWLGETEQERVRIIREWVQMNIHQRGACMDSREEPPVDAGGQIERVLDGLVANHNECRAEHIHRGIRKLCGRQALLDMIKRAEIERQTELQCLLEHRAVSNFSHRNRIQSLLRGRFLRNDRMVEGDRSTSIAASELGLLRQKQTVSGLREGFFSRLDNSGSCSASSNCADTSSNVDINGNRNEQNQVNNTHEAIDGLNDQSELENEETDNGRCLDGTTDLEADADDVSWQATSTRVEERQEQVSESVVSNRQWPTTAESNESRYDIGQVLDGASQENIPNELSLESLQNEAREHISLQESGEVSYEHYLQNVERSQTYGLTNVVENAERIPVEHIDGQEPASQAENWQEDQENEDADRQEVRVEYNELMDGGNEEASDIHRGDGGNEEASDIHREDGGNEEASDIHREDGGNEEASDIHREDGGNEEASDIHREDGGNEEASDIHREDGGNEEASDIHREDGVSEALDMQHEDGGLHDTRPSLLEGSYNQEPAAVRRTSTFYFPDDDDVYSSELRELLSRRSVSTLLHSGFRDSLDQLLQSYVERQNNASVNSDLTEATPTPELLQQDIEQQRRDQTDGQSPPTALPSPRIPSTRPLWDQESHHYNWQSHDMHQHLGIDWDIINDMRFDMARLQQRMNNMQRMMEACMDMQLELQRSIRQEVSAALNRSAVSQGMIDDDLPKDASPNWDNVRKGICCVCCDDNIDSLLYRCGHMCACLKCANELVHSGGKCPMCRAPVVEVIRAYLIN